MTHPAVLLPQSTPRTLYVSRIVITTERVQISLIMNMGFITLRINPEPKHFLSLN